MSVRKVLSPFNPLEAITVAEAARLRGRGGSEDSIRRLATRHAAGRKIGGVFCVSYPAWLMVLDGDFEALAAYHQGQTSDARVLVYFRRAGVPPPAAEEPVE